jgi:hypothetical protein
VGSDALTFEFTSIPQTFTDLLFVVSTRNTVDNAEATLFMNGADTLTSMRRLQGNGASASSSTLASTDVFPIPASTYTANTFGNVSFYFANYTISGNKSFSFDAVTETNATTSFQTLGAGLYTGTAITAVGFYNLGGGNVAAGSTASLYGILKGSDGITTAS